MTFFYHCLYLVAVISSIGKSADIVTEAVMLTVVESTLLQSIQQLQKGPNKTLQLSTLTKEEGKKTDWSFGQAFCSETVC